MQIQVEGLDVLTIGILVIVDTHQRPGDHVLSSAADDAAGRAVNQPTASFDHKSNATGNTGGRANPAPVSAACSSLGAALPRPMVISSLIPSTSW